MKNRNRIYIVSDAHLGGEEAAAERVKEDRLLALLDRVAEDAERLVILGDLFDFWFEYRRMADMAHFPVLAAIWRARRAGVRVEYFLGNHDYWTAGFLGRHIADTVHPDPVTERFGRKRALLAHGDGLSGDEKGYLLMKRILRHPLSEALFRVLHPDIGAWLSRRTSQTSRDRDEERRLHGAAILRDYARHELEAGTWDWIIAGHAHHPERTRFGDGIYLNTGDWSTHFTYGLIEGDEIRLESWGG